MAQAEEKKVLVNKESIQVNDFVTWQDCSLTNPITLAAAPNDGNNGKPNSEYSERFGFGPFEVTQITKFGNLVANLKKPSGQIFQIALWRLKKVSQDWKPDAI